MVCQCSFGGMGYQTNSVNSDVRIGVFVCVCDKGPDAMFLPLSLSLLPLDRFYRLFWCNLVGVLQLFSVYSNSNKHILQQQGHKGSTAYRVQRSYGCG